MRFYKKDKLLPKQLGWIWVGGGPTLMIQSNNPYAPRNFSLFTIWVIQSNKVQWWPMIAGAFGGKLHFARAYGNKFRRIVFDQGCDKPFNSPPLPPMSLCRDRPKHSSMCCTPYRKISGVARSSASSKFLSSWGCPNWKIPSPKASQYKTLNTNYYQYIQSIFLAKKSSVNIYIN